MQQKISGRAFGAGLGIAALLSAGVIGFLWLKAPETRLQRSEKLASQTVVIEHQEPSAVSTPVPDVAEQQPVEQAEIVELAEAPLPGLYEDVTGGRLPMIRASDKTTPFQAYRRPFTLPEGKKPVSIVVMDVGLSDSASKAVMSELSPEVTVAVTPYATTAGEWLAESRRHGHETWLKLPVEPEFYPLNDTGPQTLLVNAAPRQNLVKLHWAMARGDGYAGFVTGHQAAFMKSPNDSRPVIHDIYTRGLGFADGDISPSSVADSISAGLDGAYTHNDVWIDIPATGEHIAASLRQLEILANNNGRAVGFIHSTPLGLKMLQGWIDGLGQKGLVLAPLSAQIDLLPAAEEKKTVTTPKTP